MKFLTLSLFFLICLFGSAHDGPTSVDFTEPEVMGMDNFSVERKNGKMYIGFDIVIKNPNKLAIVIKPSSLQLHIADKKVGWVRVEEKMRIKRKSELSYPFMLVGNAGDFVKSAFSSIWDLILGKGVDFNVKGTVKAGVFFFKKKWKLDITYKMTNEEFMSMF